MDTIRTVTSRMFLSAYRLSQAPRIGRRDNQICRTHCVITGEHHWLHGAPTLGSGYRHQDDTHGTGRTDPRSLRGAYRLVIQRRSVTILVVGSALSARMADFS